MSDESDELPVKTYEVLKPLRMYRKDKGDSIELTEKAARPLIAGGWIAEPKTTKASKKDG